MCATKKNAREKSTCMAFMVHALDGVLNYSNNRVRVIYNDYRVNGTLKAYKPNGFHFEGEDGITLIFDLSDIDELRFSRFLNRVTIKLSDINDMFATI